MKAIQVDHSLIAPEPIGADLIEASRALSVTTDAESLQATELLSRIASCAKKLEENRKFYTKPLDDHKKAIMDKFRPYLEALDQARGILSRKILTYSQEQQRIAADAQTKAVADALWETERTGEIAPVIAPPMPPKTMHSESGKATVVERWDFEIVNATEVPQPYLKVDETLIRRAISQGVREIPGVRIYKTADLRVTAKGE